MLTMMYKCRCMDAEVSIEVPTRPAQGDLMLWMDVVRASIALDHQARAPRCTADVMEYAKIPVDEDAPGIGMKPPLSS